MARLYTPDCTNMGYFLNSIPNGVQNRRKKEASVLGNIQQSSESTKDDDDEVQPLLFDNLEISAALLCRRGLQFIKDGMKPASFSISNFI